MDLRVKRLSKIRVLPRPEEGLRVVMERAPQAEALAAQWIERSRPVWAWIYLSRRRLATTGVAVLTIWLFLHVMFGANGMIVYRGKRTEYQNLHKEIDQLQRENDQHAGQIKALKTDPQSIEKEAREQLHYARPGEVVYVAPGQSNPQTPDSQAARK